MWNEVDATNTETLGKDRKVKRIFNPKYASSTSGLSKAARKKKKQLKKTVVK